MERIRRHLSYANVAATLALVFAMTGGAIAATGGFSSSGKLQACVGSGGTLKLLKSGQRCHHGQQKVGLEPDRAAGPGRTVGARRPVGHEPDDPRKSLGRGNGADGEQRAVARRDPRLRIHASRLRVADRADQGVRHGPGQRRVLGGQSAGVSQLQLQRRRGRSAETAERLVRSPVRRKSGGDRRRDDFGALGRN